MNERETETETDRETNRNREREKERGGKEHGFMMQKLYGFKVYLRLLTLDEEFFNRVVSFRNK